MWRVEREGSGLTEGCLVSVDDLQNHVEHFGEEEQKELRLDVDTFLQYWPPQSQQFSMQYISHIFGVVRRSSLNVGMGWGGGGPATPELPGQRGRGGTSLVIQWSILPVPKQGVQVQSLVVELRSHMTHTHTKQNRQCCSKFNKHFKNDLHQKIKCGLGKPRKALEGKGGLR